MPELVFSDKNCSIEFNLSSSAYNFPLKKPMLCPHCGAFQNGIKNDSKLYPGYGENELGTVCYKCSYCAQHYVVVYLVNRTERIAKFGTFYPIKTMTYENEIIKDISPRFIDSYNQALRAESNGDIELAAIGYRQSLECLVKDYAIIELSKPTEEVVKKSLCNAISEYLGEKDFVATADVIRILGNDYAHYERKYPEHDFQLLKRYMQIFISMVESKLLISHPPVARKD